MTKEKKAKKDKSPKAEKKGGAKVAKVPNGAKAPKVPKATDGGSKLKALAEHPLVGEVVAAALVATATALKNPDRARALASEAADELGKLSKVGSERGNALWEMALQIGRRSLESLAGDAAQTKPAGKKRSQP